MTPFEFDMALQEPVFYMMRRGIRVDEALRTEMAQKAHEEWGKWQRLLNEVAARQLNVNSDTQVHNYLYHDPNGLKQPVRRKNKKVTADEDALRAIMAQAEAKRLEAKTQASQTKWMRVFLSAKLMLKIRAVRKQLSSYLGCPPNCGCKKPSQVLADEDGRMRCTITVGGTETMRFSHSKTLWDTGLNMATNPHSIRPIFVADDGMEMAEFDLNRGESWVYAFLSMDPELIRIHTNGADFHAETAEAIQTAFGGGGLSSTEIRRLAKTGDVFGYRIRFLGKKTNHASSYRMGPFRGAEVVNEEADETNITVTPSQMEKAQRLWRQKYVGIELWWNDIDRTLDKTRTLTTPYGRVRKFYGFMSDHLKKEATAYVPQSTSVDYLNRGMLRVYKELVERGAYGLELLQQTHDSILVQYQQGCRDEVFPEIIARLTSTVVINDHEVSIPVEGLYGQNWGDYHPERNPQGLREWEG